jgi:hypothetical protein
MSRKQISWIAAAALGFAAWHFGLGAQVSAVWKTIGSGTRAMTGETAIDVGQDAKRSLVQSNLERAMREYRATVGQEPASLQSLVDAGLLQRGDIRDEWSRPLVTEIVGSRLEVRSAGRDGKSGTEDDWTLTP